MNVVEELTKKSFATYFKFSAAQKATGSCSSTRTLKNASHFSLQMVPSPRNSWHMVRQMKCCSRSFSFPQKVPLALRLASNSASPVSSCASEASTPSSWTYSYSFSSAMDTTGNGTLGKAAGTVLSKIDSGVKSSLRASVMTPQSSSACYIWHIPQRMQSFNSFYAPCSNTALRHPTFRTSSLRCRSTSKRCKEPLINASRGPYCV